VCVTGIALAVALLVAMSGAKQYRATSRVLLNDTQVVGIPQGTPTVPNPDPERDINTKIALIKLPPIVNAVNHKLHLGMTTRQLAKKVETAAEGSSNIVDITATAKSRSDAKAIATAFAQEYASFRRDVAQSSLREAADQTRSQLSALGPAGQNSAQGIALSKQVRALTLAAAVQTGGALVVTKAPNAIASPSHSKALVGIVGVIVGGLIAILAVFLLELTDRRIKDPDDVAAGFGETILAEIPQPRFGFGRRQDPLAAEQAVQLDAYDHLAAQVVLAARRRVSTTLMVTSPGTGDGTVPVTLGMARALSRMDRRVLVIELDARTSIMSGTTGVEGPGMSGVLAGASSLEDAIIDLEGISLLPAGTGEHPADRLFTKPKVARAVAAARELADFVLVVGPPTHRLHEALDLVDGVDAALLVARLRFTRTDALHRGVDTLRAMSLRILGLVLTDTLGAGSTRRAPTNGSVIPLEITEGGAARRAARGRQTIRR
jgi:capsular polysaccharide biosynthesis protein/Mrp family chromosome partitioning ATPase